MEMLKTDSEIKEEYVPYLDCGGNCVSIHFACRNCLTNLCKEDEKNFAIGNETPFCPKCAKKILAEI